MLHLIFILLAVHCAADERVTRLAVKNTYQDGSPTYISTEISTFMGLAYDSVMFVDRSLLIKEIMENGNKVFLITCPRRWGKSVNLNMLQVFFQLRVNDRGELIRINKTFNHLIFVRGEVWEKDRERLYLRSPLLIAQYPLFIARHLCQYPVIYVEFDYTGLENTFTSLVEGMRIGMSNAYAEHKYLITKYTRHIQFNDTITEEKRDKVRLRFNRVYDFIYYGDSLTPFDVLSGIQSLSELLYYFFRRKVIILIDEYHAFWEKILTVQWTKKDEKEAFLKYYVKFMEKTFQNNTFYLKGVITGVHPPPQEAYDGFFNSTVECNLLTGKLMQFYGFNKSVIDEFYQTLNLAQNSRAKVDRWYGGYRVPNDNYLQLYNPLSMANFVSEDEFDKYWIKEYDITSFILNSLKYDPFRYQFHDLVDGKETKVQIQPYRYTWNELETVYKIFRSDDKGIDYNSPISLRVFILLLYTEGYLTVTNNCGNDIAFMKFPNEEVRLAMKRNLEEFYQRMLGLDHMHPSIANNVRKEFDKFIRFTDEDSFNFRKTLENYLNQNQSIVRILKFDDPTENRLILFELISYLLIDEQCDHKEKFDYIRYQIGSFPMAVVQFGKHATIIDIKYNQRSAEAVLDISRSYKYNPAHPLEVNVTKFIGLNVLTNNTVEAACEYKLKDETFAVHRIS